MHFNYIPHEVVSAKLGLAGVSQGYFVSSAQHQECKRKTVAFAVSNASMLLEVTTFFAFICMENFCAFEIMLGEFTWLMTN